MVDVGGKKTERKEWIHCFENVKAVMLSLPFQTMISNWGKSTGQQAQSS